MEYGEWWECRESRWECVESWLECGECRENNKIEIEKNEIIQFSFFSEIEKTKKKENEIRIVIKR